MNKDPSYGGLLGTEYAKRMWSRIQEAKIAEYLSKRAENGNNIRIRDPDSDPNNNVFRSTSLF